MKQAQQTELADVIYQHVMTNPGNERSQIVEVLRGKVKAGTIQCYLDKMRKVGYVKVLGKGYEVVNSSIKHITFSDINKPVKGRTFMSTVNNTPAITTPAQPTAPAPVKPPLTAEVSRHCPASEVRNVALVASYNITIGDTVVNLSYSEARALKKQLDSVLAV